MGGSSQYWALTNWTSQITAKRLLACHSWFKWEYQYAEYGKRTQLPGFLNKSVFDSYGIAQLTVPNNKALCLWEFWPGKTWHICNLLYFWINSCNLVDVWMKLHSLYLIPKLNKRTNKKINVKDINEINNNFHKNNWPLWLGLRIKF